MISRFESGRGHVNFFYRMACWDVGFIAAVYIHWGGRAFIEWARVKPGESTHNST